MIFPNPPLYAKINYYPSFAVGFNEFLVQTDIYKVMRCEDKVSCDLTSFFLPELLKFFVPIAVFDSTYIFVR
jgi:hypothetical protein